MTDYIFYVDTYLMGRQAAIGPADFPFYARGAGQIIKQYTFGHIDLDEPICEAVQLCCCELAEYARDKERRGEKSNGIKSEKVDDYSVTFEDISSIEATDNQRQKDIVSRWLGGTGLLYCGV